MSQTPRQLTKPLAITTGALFVVLAAWLFRPHPHPPAHLVEPRLLALHEPFIAVWATYFTNGGSIGIDITDAWGNREKFAIPNRMFHNEGYQKVFIGALHVKHAGTVPVAHHDATKRELVCILAKHRTDAGVAHALAILSGRLSDQARNQYNVWRGNLNKP